MRLVVGAAVVSASLLAVAAMRLSPLFAALLLCLALLPTRAADGTATTLDDCLAAGDVWLLVIDDADTTRANQCVGTPRIRRGGAGRRRSGPSGALGGR